MADGFIAMDGDSGRFVTIPLTDFKTSTEEFTLQFDAVAEEARLVAGDRVLQFPAGYLPQELVSLPDCEVVIVRRLFREELRIFQFGPDDVRTEIPVPAELQGAWFRGATAAGSRVVLCFLTGGKHLVYTVAPGSDGHASFGAAHAELNEASGDFTLRMTFASDAVYLVIENSLYQISFTDENQPLATRLNYNRNLTWLELVTVKDVPYGLGVVRASYTPSLPAAVPRLYYIYDLATLKVISAHPFPYNLRAEGDSLAYSTIDRVEDLAAVFKNDLISRENSGLMYMGASQDEGRIGWGSVYYLEGLIDLLKEWPSAFPTWSHLEDLKSQLRTRLDLEMSLVDRLLDPENEGFAARRYSLNRELLLWPVHSGRGLRLFKRYSKEIQDAKVLRNLDEFKEETETLRGHNSEIVTAGPGDLWLPEGTSYLRSIKGMPVTFDGVNMPFNQQNAWADGVLYGESASNLSPATLDAARGIIETFLLDPSFNPPPEDNRWLYWWGQGRAGWTAEDGVSVNTPSYAGHRGYAARTYRTLDARALLTASQVWPDLVQFDLVEWAVGAMETGTFEFYFLEELAAHGVRPEMNAWHTLQSLRPGGAYQVQSAIWAHAILQDEPWLQSFTLRIGETLRTAEGLQFHFQTRPGYLYKIESSPLVRSGTWTGHGTTYGTGRVETSAAPASPGTTAFYRVVESPVP